MTRYILIEMSSGYIWGDCHALDPVDAARRTEAEVDGDSYVEKRSYTEHGPNARYTTGIGPDWYRVYEAPEGFPEVDDGQSRALIEAVERDCTPVAMVEVTDTAA